MGIGKATVIRASSGDVGWPLRRAVRLYGSFQAIVDDQRSVSYAELGRRVGALGAGLEELDVPSGGRVGFMGVNSLAHVECAIGVSAAGRVMVDLNFRLAEAELAFIAADCASGCSSSIGPNSRSLGRCARAAPA